MRTQITLAVNDTVHAIAVDPVRTLLSVMRDELGPVSYTHLTLPTSDLV